MERPLPTGIPEAAPRERLRWEKELLGLYLSDHPIGEHATQLARFVTAYSSDMGEELDQQRVVVGGVVTETRRVITKARATMGVVTLEDLQGTIEVIVFPKVYELTSPTWQEDAILLVSGRVDHKGEETVLLADAVWPWDEAVALGPDAIAQQVARGDRGRRNAYSNGSRLPREPVPVGPGRSDAAPPEPLEPVERLEDAGPQAPVVRTVPRVSPLRGVVLEGTIDVVLRGAKPIAPVPRREPSEPSSVALLAHDHDEEPPLPEEARRDAAAADEAPTVPIQATAGQSLEIRLLRTGDENVGRDFEALREIIHQRPGDTSVVLYVPGAGGRRLRMQLGRKVAYDAELLSLIRRRLGDRMVELALVASGASPSSSP